MARIIKSGILLPISLVLSVSAFGGSFDGQWQINEEISMADCMDWTKSIAQNDNLESNAWMAEMMEGFSNKICVGFVKNVSPQINIKNNKTTLKAFEKEVECTVYPKPKIFKCDTEKNGNENGKEGTINVIDGQLVWGVPPESEKIFWLFTYDKG